MSEAREKARALLANATQGPVNPKPADLTPGGPSSATLAKDAGPAIAELRRLTGFTWEQLARIFSVSRRALHFWGSGKAMAPSNEEHLQRLLAVIRRTDRGSADANRAALLAAREDGTIPFDLLIREQYEQVVEILGASAARRVQVPKLSSEAMAARMPPPPENLVEALHDRIHASSGRLLAAEAERDALRAELAQEAALRAELTAEVKRLKAANAVLGARVAIVCECVKSRQGPRSMRDLAKVLDMLPSTLHLQLTGRRPMQAETAAAIRRALPEIQDHE